MLAAMSPARKRKGASRLPATLATLLCGALAARALLAALEQRLALFALWGHGSTLLLAGLGLALALALLALPAGWQPGRSRPPLRVLAAAALAAALVQLVAQPPWRPLVALWTFGVAAGLWPAAVLLAPAAVRALPPRLLARLDLCCAGALVLAVGGELALTALAHASSSPLFAREGESAGTFIARHRLRAEGRWQGFPVNSAGHFDEEFTVGTPGAPVVVTIGDSFSTSIVPHAFHFTTVAERALGRGRVHNLGVAAIGPREYEHLLLTEALPLRPSLVVVNVFVGNDLVLPAPAAGGWAARLLDRQRLLAWLVPERLATLALEGSAAGDARGAPPALGATSDAPTSEADLLRLYPWLADPLREVAAFSPAGFLRVELARARDVCRPDAPPDWDALLATLRRMAQAAAPVPLAVMLIPDEFQVEDAVWSEVRRAAGDLKLQRDLPQQVLVPALAQASIPCLDLLPVLRAVAPLRDGRRHVYHLRETHWNARGNAAAGEALARFVADYLP